jgi:hypothetical protein
MFAYGFGVPLGPLPKFSAKNIELYFICTPCSNLNLNRFRYKKSIYGYTTNNS